MAEPERSWTAEQLGSDAVSKKDLVTFLQQYGSLAVGILLYLTVRPRLLDF